jgi:hypothetical protein
MVARHDTTRHVWEVVVVVLGRGVMFSETDAQHHATDPTHKHTAHTRPHPHPPARFIDAASRYYELSSITTRHLGAQAIAEEDLVGEETRFG